MELLPAPNTFGLFQRNSTINNTSDLSALDALNVMNEQNDTTTSLLKPPLKLWCVLGYLSITILGIVTNIIAFSLMYRQISLHYTYLKVITCLDLIFCIFFGYGSMMGYVSYSQHYVLAFVNTFIALPVWWAASNASTLLTVLVTFDRVYHIISPLQARAIVTRNKVTSAVILAIILACGLRMDIYLNFKVHSLELNNTIVYWTGCRNYGSCPYLPMALLQAFTFEYFPVVAMAISNIIIYRGIQKMRTVRRTLRMNVVGQNWEDLKEKKTAIERLWCQFFLISTLSIVCNVPNTILRLIWPKYSDMADLKHVSNMLYALDHSINLFVYLIYGHDFKTKQKRASDCTFQGQVVSNNNDTRSTET